MATAELIAWAQTLRADFERLAAALLDLDADPTTKLLAAGGLTGASAAPAAAAGAALDRLWALLPAVRAQLDAVDAERARGRKADETVIGTALTGRVVELDATLAAAAMPGAAGPAASGAAAGGAGGAATVTLTVAEAMNRLVADLAVASDVIGRIGTAWRDGLPALDTARSRLAALAAELGAFPEADALAAALARADAAAATDPLLLADTLVSLRGALDAAERAAVALRAARDGLGAALDEAARLLATIDQTIRDGMVALDEARAKIAAPAGLLAPLDPVTVLDSGPRALVPWLGRLRTAAGTDWRAATNGLAAWRSLADGVAATATRVRDANRAPVERRNELRGLLSGLAAKAAATGRAEAPDATARHEAARALLYVAPCDLDAAAAAVDAFARFVNGDAAGPRGAGAGGAGPHRQEDQP